MLGQSTTARPDVTAAARLFSFTVPRRVAHGLYALRIARGFLGEALALKTALALDRNRRLGYQPYEAASGGPTRLDHATSGDRIRAGVYVALGVAAVVSLVAVVLAAAA